MSIFSVLCRASSQLLLAVTQHSHCKLCCHWKSEKNLQGSSLCYLKHCCLQIVICRLARSLSFAPLVLLICLESFCSAEEAATAQSLSTDCPDPQFRTCSEEGKTEVHAWKRNVLALLSCWNRPITPRRA